MDGDKSRYAGPEHRGCNRATSGRNGHGPGSVSGSFKTLEEKLPAGIVRCGLCGYLILKGEGWRSGRVGPEHSPCGFEPTDGFDPFGVRLCTRDFYGRPQ